MKRELRRWEIVGFAATGLVGTLLHFVYGWSDGSRVAAAFSAVNESTWEHMKLLFLPYFVFAVVEFIVFSEAFRNFFGPEIIPAAFNCRIIVNNARLGIVLGCRRLAEHPNGSENAERERSGKSDNGEDNEGSGLRVPFFKFVHNFVLSVLGRGTALRLVARPV